MRNLKRQNKQSNNIIHCILKQASLHHFSAVIFCVPEIMNNIQTCTSQKVIDNSIQNFSVLSETLILYQYFLNVRKKQLNSLLSNGLTTGAKVIELFYYIHFEITGVPCNLIGSQQCDVLTNHTICSKSLLL